MATRIHYREDRNNYLVYFSNPLNKKDNKKIHNLTKNEAVKKAQELDYKFYNKNRGCIPSGITLDSSNKRFRVYTRYGILKSFKTVLEALEFRQNILIDLTEPKYLTTGKIKLFINE